MQSSHTLFSWIGLQDHVVWSRTDDKGYLAIGISSMTMISGCWNPNNKKWLNVGSVSYLGLSEVNTNGNVRTVNFNSSNANQNWNNQKYPQVFLACEHCNRPVISGWSFFFLLLLYIWINLYYYLICFVPTMMRDVAREIHIVR